MEECSRLLQPSSSLIYFTLLPIRVLILKLSWRLLSPTDFVVIVAGRNIIDREDEFNVVGSV